MLCRENVSERKRIKRMKVCGKCGFVNADDSNFCESCGGKLSQQNVTPQYQNIEPQQENVTYQYQNVEPQYQNVEPQQKKKSNVIGIVIAVIVVAVVIAVAVLLFVRKPSKNKENMPEKETVQNSQQEENISEEKEQEEERQEKQPESVDKEQAGDDKKQVENDKKEAEDYSDVDINAVDNAYIQITGTVARKDGQIILNIPQAVSMCAYDDDEQIIKKDNITSMALFSEDSLENYIGTEVSIKGKLSADPFEKFILQVVKMDVEKEASVEDEAFSEGHRYQLILEDATWQEAYNDCLNRGGYLVQINSEEEFQSVIEMIEDAGMQNVHFYLGGRRDADSHEYYWVDERNGLAGTMLNPEGTSWAAVHWMENEPSFSSEDEEEMYMNLIYYKDNWVLNDVPMDITIYYPGKTGYICEFDE